MKNKDKAPTRGKSPSNGSITTLSTPWIYGNTRGTYTTYTHDERTGTISGLTFLHTEAVDDLETRSQLGLHSCPVLSPSFSVTYYGNYRVQGAKTRHVVFTTQLCSSTPRDEAHFDTKDIYLSCLVLSSQLCLNCNVN